MKIRNKKITLVFLTLFSLFFIALVSASPILVSPASSAIISGTSTLSASNGTLKEMTSCIFYAKSPSTANSTYTSIGTGTNTTASATSISTTFNSNILEDSNDYSFLAACSNATTQQNSTASTGITIDNTVPTAPVLNVSTNTLLTSKVTNYNFKGTVTDSKTTGCTYSIYRNDNPSDGASGTATYSGSSCSFTKSFTSSLDNGNWYFKITASDGTNSTNSPTNILQVQLSSNSGGLPMGYKVSKEHSLSIVKSQSSKDNILFVLGAIILVTLLYFIFKKK